MPDKSVSLSTVRGLTATEVSRLKKVGIDNTKELLAAASTTSKEKALAAKAGLTQDRMREAVNRADLLRLSGMGPATADLFENAGVNSVKELAQRNPATLAATLKNYVGTHPELNFHAPSATTVANFVARAKAVGTPAVTPSSPVTTPAQASVPAAAALHKYIDEVLFSNHPDGESFRSNILDGRPASEIADLKARMHDGVNGFVGTGNSRDGELEEVADQQSDFVFVGRLLGLYTEVNVKKADGSVPRVYVEID